VDAARDWTASAHEKGGGWWLCGRGGGEGSVQTAEGKGLAHEDDRGWGKNGIPRCEVTGRARPEGRRTHEEADSRRMTHQVFVFHSF
jgi:hypothetical protein